MPEPTGALYIGTVRVGTVRAWRITSVGGILTCTASGRFARYWSSAGAMAVVLRPTPSKHLLAPIPFTGVLARLSETEAVFTHVRRVE